MATQRRKMTNEYRCKWCGKTYTSMLRLLHHQAAEHALKRSKDIRTTKDVKHNTGD